jgi:hypothetical protein
MTDDGISTSQIDHCVAKIRQLVADGRDDRRAVLQLGYNLGRLSELTGGGRGPFWDAWKDAIGTWDRARLEALARDLHIRTGGRLPDLGESPALAEPKLL